MVEATEGVRLGGADGNRIGNRGVPSGVSRMGTSTGLGLCGPRYGLRDLIESGDSTFLNTGFGLGAGTSLGLGTGVLDLTESGV